MPAACEGEVKHRPAADDVKPVAEGRSRWWPRAAAERHTRAQNKNRVERKDTVVVRVMPWHGDQRGNAAVRGAQRRCSRQALTATPQRLLQTQVNKSETAVRGCDRLCTAVGTCNTAHHGCRKIQGDIFSQRVLGADSC